MDQCAHVQAHSSSGNQANQHIKQSFIVMKQREEFFSSVFNDHRQTTQKAILQLVQVKAKFQNYRQAFEDPIQKVINIQRNQEKKLHQLQENVNFQMKKVYFLQDKFTQKKNQLEEYEQSLIREKQRLNKEKQLHQKKFNQLRNERIAFFRLQRRQDAELKKMTQESQKKLQSQSIELDQKILEFQKQKSDFHTDKKALENQKLLLRKQQDRFSQYRRKINEKRQFLEAKQKQKRQPETNIDWDKQFQQQKILDQFQRAASKRDLQLQEKKLQEKEAIIEKLEKKINDAMIILR